MFQGRVCRYKDMHCLLFLLLLLLSSPSASSSICPFYLAPPRVSIRLAFVLVIDFPSRSVRHLITDQPSIRSAVQTVLTYFIFRNMSFMSKMSWFFLPSSPPFAVLPPFLLSLIPPLSSPYTFFFPFSSLILPRTLLI